eukprot:gene16268-22159_t
MKVTEFLVVILHFLPFAGLISSFSIDPTDFFSGTHKRPKLEIVYPDNGQVLDNGDLNIKIKVDGYDLPSNFHSSTICIGLSTGFTFAENCFDQSKDLVFQANGLSPGNQYALRVVLYERGNAIAVSVRNFRVAGIRGLFDSSDEIVTIQAAVQIAVQYQVNGLEEKAERIYRSVLSENPTNADALHLLGVILYQQGDAKAAIPYIERALLSNTTFEGFHNTLGVCYRTLGRLQEAKHQFERALMMNPNYLTATFNLGLVQQQLNQWNDAIISYQKIVDSSAKDETRLESKIRECDLLAAQEMIEQAISCWQIGMNLFPSNSIIPNELANLYGKIGKIQNAYEMYEVSAHLGSLQAAINSACMLEILGFAHNSTIAFHHLLDTYANPSSNHANPNQQENKLYSTAIQYINIRLSLSQYRINPNVSEIIINRNLLEKQLSLLLEMNLLSDNTSPVDSGYTLGYHFLFHGYDNVSLKSKLYRLYVKLCPALLQGYFIDQLNMSQIDEQMKAIIKTYNNNNNNNNINDNNINNNNNNNNNNSNINDNNINNNNNNINNINNINNNINSNDEKTIVYYFHHISSLYYHHDEDSYTNKIIHGGIVNRHNYDQNDDIFQIQSSSLEEDFNNDYNNNLPYEDGYVNSSSIIPEMENNKIATISPTANMVITEQPTLSLD